jgi:hypothetical protein
MIGLVLAGGSRGEMSLVLIVELGLDMEEGFELPPELQGCRRGRLLTE